MFGKVKSCMLRLRYFFVIAIVLLASTGFGAQKWQKTNGPYNTTHMYALEMHPANKSVLYAGTNRGIYRTEDGAASWQELKNGISTDFAVIDIVIDPKDPEVIYALGNENSGFYKSIDGGDQWSELNIVLSESDGALYSLAIDPKNTEVLYVAGFGCGFFQTINGGDTWSRISLGEVCNDEISRIETITVSPHDANIIYIGTSPRASPLDTGGGGSILVSKDQGDTWSTLLSESPLDGRIVYTIVVDPVNPDIIYFGTDGMDDPVNFFGLAYKSTDGGKTWNAIYDTNIGGMDRVYSIALNPDQPEMLYVAGGRSFNFSVDGGATWEFSTVNNYDTANMRPPNIHSIAVDFTNTTVYCGGYGVLKSTDGGQNFTLAVNGLESDKTRSLKIDPFDANCVHAITAFGYGATYTTDGGETWQLSESGFYDNYGMIVEIDQTAQGDTVYASAGWGLWRSTDKGRNWDWMSNQFQYSHVHGIAIDPLNSNNIFVGIGSDESNPSGQGFFKSTDGGSIWENISEDANGFPEGIHVAEIRIDPTDPQTVYICTRGDTSCGDFDAPCTPGDGIYKSTDRGENWTAKNNGLTNLNIASMVINPYDPNILYAGAVAESLFDSGDGGVFKSTDGGENWSPVNTGLSLPEQDPPMKFGVHSLVIDPANPDTLYAAIMDPDSAYYRGAIFRTTDGGDHWELFTDGLERDGSDLTPGVEFLDIDPTGQVLYAAIKAGPVYKYGEISQPDTIAPVIIAGPALFDLTTAGITIKWNTHEESEGWVEYGVSADYGTIVNDVFFGNYHAVMLEDLDVNKSYHFRVGVIDQLGNGPRYSKDFTFNLGTMDTEPPAISSVTERYSTTDFGPYQITADIKDNFGINQAYLFYSIDNGAFTKLAMTNVCGNQYLAEIPQVSGPGYVDYYIEAGDTSGNSSLAPSTAPYGAHSFLVDEEQLSPYIYVSQEAGSVSLLDGTTYELVEQITLNGSVYGLTASSTGDFLVGLANWEIAIIGTQDNEVQDRLTNDENIFPLDWPIRGSLSPDDQTLYIIRNSQGENVVVVGLNPLEYQNAFSAGQNLTDIGISPDGAWLLLTDDVYLDSQLIMVSASDFSNQKTISLGAHAGGITFSKDGKYAYVGGVTEPPFAASILYKIDIATQAIIDEVDLLSAFEAPVDILINRKNNMAYVVVGQTASTFVVMVDLDNYTALETSSVSTSFVQQASLRDDDRFIYLSDMDGNVLQVFDTHENAFADTITVDSPTATINAVLSGTGVCSYTLSSTCKSFNSEGGTDSVSVTATASDCDWTAASNDSWITIDSGSSGIGNGTVSYSVSSNTGTNSRTGTITIAGETFTVTQEGQPAVNPLPDIRANGSDGPVVLQLGENLSVTVSLNPRGNGDNADWWVVAVSPFGLYWFTLDLGWVRSDTPIRVYGGPLFNLSSYPILSISTLPVGEYTFSFAVDDNMDGTKDDTYKDSVLVTIQ